MPIKFKAAIFDMDGVVVDSEYYWQSYELKIWQRLGVNDDREFRENIVGLGINSIAKMLGDKYGIKISADKLAVELDEEAKNVYQQQCNLLPGVRDFLNLLRENSVKLALASASPQNWVDMVMDRFGLREYFSLALSTRTMRIPPKPDPAVFARAMEKIQVSPDLTLVFEDSSYGVLAGTRSGATTVAVNDGRWALGKVGKSDLTIQSFKEQELHDFLSL